MANGTSNTVKVTHPTFKHAVDAVGGESNAKVILERHLSMQATEKAKRAVITNAIKAAGGLDALVAKLATQAAAKK